MILVSYVILVDIISFGLILNSITYNKENAPHIMPWKNFAQKNLIMFIWLWQIEIVWVIIHMPPNPTQNPVKKLATKLLLMLDEVSTPSDISKIAEII